MNGMYKIISHVLHNVRQIGYEYMISSEELHAILCNNNITWHSIYINAYLTVHYIYNKF